MKKTDMDMMRDQFLNDGGEIKKVATSKSKTKYEDVPGQVAIPVKGSKLAVTATVKFSGRRNDAERSYIRESFKGKERPAITGLRITEQVDSNGVKVKGNDISLYPPPYFPVEAIMGKDKKTGNPCHRP